jgi:hypothetical protein
LQKQALQADLCLLAKIQHVAIGNFAIFFVAKAVITGFDSQLFVALSRADFITRACFIGARLPALAGINDTRT